MGKMNKSYREKIEYFLENGKVSKEMLLGCIYKANAEINKIEYNLACYKNAGEICLLPEQKIKKSSELKEYRKPFQDVLYFKYKLSVEEINKKLEKFPENKIPTKNFIEKVRALIVNNEYEIVC